MVSYRAGASCLNGVPPGPEGRYCRGYGADWLPDKGADMADKSPRQGMSKKSGKSIKEKRADKKSKSDGGTPSIVEKMQTKKK